MTRAEHVRQAKARAHECLDRGELGTAIVSMFNDLGQHPETQDLATNTFLAMVGVFDAMQHDERRVRSFIDGFTE